jgi:hypothetical protein
MAKPALNFSKLSIGGKILRIRQIVLATTGNSVYTTPSPTLASITTAVNQLEVDQLALKNGGPLATRTRNVQNKVVMALMNSFAAYVMVTSGGDAIKIASTTLDIVQPPSFGGLANQVVRLSGATGKFPGTVLLKWKSMIGIKYYYIQKSADGLMDWASQGEPVTMAKVVITGLVSETASFYRVAAGNVTGLCPNSDPVRVVAK